MDAAQKGKYLSRKSKKLFFGAKTWSSLRFFQLWAAILCELRQSLDPMMSSVAGLFSEGESQ